MSTHNAKQTTFLSSLPSDLLATIVQIVLARLIKERDPWEGWTNFYVIDLNYDPVGFFALLETCRGFYELCSDWDTNARTADLNTQCSCIPKNLSMYSGAEHFPVKRMCRFTIVNMVRPHIIRRLYVHIIHSICNGDSTNTRKMIQQGGLWNCNDTRHYENAPMGSFTKWPYLEHYYESCFFTKPAFGPISFGGVAQNAIQMKAQLDAVLHVVGAIVGLESTVNFSSTDETGTFLLYWAAMLQNPVIYEFVCKRIDLSPNMDHNIIFPRHTKNIHSEETFYTFGCYSWLNLSLKWGETLGWSPLFDIVFQWAYRGSGPCTHPYIRRLLLQVRHVATHSRSTPMLKMVLQLMENDRSTMIEYLEEMWTVHCWKDGACLICSHLLALLESVDSKTNISTTNRLLCLLTTALGIQGRAHMIELVITHMKYLCERDGGRISTFENELDEALIHVVQMGDVDAARTLSMQAQIQLHTGWKQS